MLQMRSSVLLRGMMMVRKRPGFVASRGRIVLYPATPIVTRERYICQKRECLQVVLNEENNKHFD